MNTFTYEVISIYNGEVKEERNFNTQLESRIYFESQIEKGIFNNIKQVRIINHDIRETVRCFTKEL